MTFVEILIFNFDVNMFTLLGSVGNIVKWNGVIKSKSVVKISREQHCRIMERRNRNLIFNTGLRVVLACRRQIYVIFKFHRTYVSSTNPNTSQRIVIGSVWSSRQMLGEKKTYKDVYRMFQKDRNLRMSRKM